MLQARVGGKFFACVSRTVLDNQSKEGGKRVVVFNFLSPRLAPRQALLEAVGIKFLSAGDLPALNFAS